MTQPKQPPPILLGPVPETPDSPTDDATQLNALILGWLAEAPPTAARALALAALIQEWAAQRSQLKGRHPSIDRLFARLRVGLTEGASIIEKPDKAPTPGAGPVNPST